MSKNNRHPNISEQNSKKQGFLTLISRYKPLIEVSSIFVGLAIASLGLAVAVLGLVVALIPILIG